MAYPPPPYADAVCGTFVCGEAICGAWWAYPASPKLALGGYLPAVNLGNVVPPAGLRLLAYVPDVALGAVVQPGQAALRLQASAPTGLTISSIINAPQALLVFGAYIEGVFIGQVFLFPDVCTDLDLVAVQCREVDLVPTVCRP